MSMAQFHKSCKQLDGGIDLHLTNYMIETSSLRSLADFDSQTAIAVGLKGIGKSSAFRYLTEVEKSADVILAVNPDRYTLHLPQKGFSYSVYRKQFERDFIFEALRGVVHQSDKFKEKLHGTLLSDAKKTVGSFVELLRTAGRKISDINISIIGIGLTVQRDNSKPEGLIPEKDISNARRLLTDICKSGVRIRMVIDDPEEVFSLGSGLDVQMLAGFCLASLRLSSTIPGLKIIGLLKTHVYHPVNKYTEDLSKYPDHAASLSWSKGELQQLVAQRLQAASTEWEQLLTSSSSGTSQTRLLQTMIKSVRNGPRDLLRWLDLSLTASGDKPVNAMIINQSFEQMGINSFDEFARAHSCGYENIDLLVKTLFSNKTNAEFTIPEFKKHIQDLLIKDKTIKTLQNHEWFLKMPWAKIPLLLFETGSVCFKYNRQLILPYQAEYTQRNFEKATTIALTPSFRPSVKKYSL